MKIEVAELLARMADEDGNIDCSVRAGYCARGAFGRETAGVVVDRITSVAYLAALAVDYLHSAGREDEVDELLREVKGLGWDSMGLSVILY